MERYATEVKKSSKTFQALINKVYGALVLAQIRIKAISSLQVTRGMSMSVTSAMF